MLHRTDASVRPDALSRPHEQVGPHAQSPSSAASMDAASRPRARAPTMSGSAGADTRPPMPSRRWGATLLTSKGSIPDTRSTSARPSGPEVAAPLGRERPSVVCTPTNRSARCLPAMSWRREPLESTTDACLPARDRARRPAVRPGAGDAAGDGAGRHRTRRRHRRQRVRVGHRCDSRGRGGCRRQRGDRRRAPLRDAPATTAAGSQPRRTTAEAAMDAPSASLPAITRRPGPLHATTRAPSPH